MELLHHRTALHMPTELRIQHRPVLLAIERGAVTDAELTELLDAIERELRRADITRLRVVGIVDVSGRDGMNAAHRDMRARWFERHDQLVRRTLLGVVLVVPSALVRGAVLAQNAISPPLVPQRVAPSLDAAIRAAERLLEHEGGELPAELARLGARAFD